MKEGRIIAILVIGLLGYLFSLYLHFIIDSKQSPILLKDQLATSNQLRFDVIGDFGEVHPLRSFPILPVQVVAESMSSHSLQDPIDMILTVGDNFYPKLVSSFDSTIFQVMEQVFALDGIHNKPWYLLYGNHDCYFKDDYGETLEKFYHNIFMPKCPWNMTVPVGEFKVAFTFLSCYLQCYGHIYNPRVQNQCRKENAMYNATNEYLWLETHLQEINQDPDVIWNFVFIHYPLFSVSAIDGDVETLKVHLFPLLKKYKVDVVFSGHNHNMQYLSSKKYVDGNEYFHQNDTDLCTGPFIVCNGENVICWDKNVTCPDGNGTCSDKFTWEDNSKLAVERKEVTYKKGEELHQVIMGASGANLDMVCKDSFSPMADLVFGLSDYGFSEVTLTENQLEIKYIHANTSEVVFKSTIFK